MNPSIFQRWSLKTRVTIFTLIVFLSGIWSLAFYANRMLREEMQRQLGEQQFATVSLLARHVNEELEDRLRALQIIAGTVTPSILGNAGAMQALLEKRPIFQQLFNGGIIATGPDGTTIADFPLSEGRIGVNYMDRDFAIAALKEGRSSIGQPVMGRKLAAPVFATAVPIRDTQGKVIGALIGVVNLGKHNFLDGVAESKYGRTGGYILIAPQHRLSVTATDKTYVMQPIPALGVNPLFDRYVQGFEGYGHTVDSRGLEVFSSAKQIPIAGWLLVSRISAEEAFAPISAMQLRLLLATICFTLLTGCLTWWMTWRMLRLQLSPMLAATKTLGTMTDETQPSQPLPITSQDEIGELIGGFNRLLETLTQREQALKKSEHKLSVILESVEGHIYLKDTQGRYLFANRPVRELFGASMDEIVGQSDEKFFDAETVARIRENDRQVLREGKTLETEEVNVNLKDGHSSTYLSVKLPLRNEAGQIYALCGISTDITERKRQENVIKERNELLTRKKVELEATLTRIRRLEGLLSICMSCKSIRSEDSSWQHFERYLGEHSDAVFSHGLCPKCFERQKELLD